MRLFDCSSGGGWGGCSDSFSCPFDGDPLNCCHAARLSRRGWESQAVEGAGWAEPGEGRGMLREGRGCRCRSPSFPSFFPSLGLGGCGSTGRGCARYCPARRAWGGSGSTCACAAECRLGHPWRCWNCGGKKLGKGHSD